MVSRYAKLFEVIFDNKLEVDPSEVGSFAFAKRMQRAQPVSDSQAKQAVQTLIDAFAWRISSKFLKPTIVLGRFNELMYLALFPQGAWTRNKNDMNRYTVGTIEMDAEIEGRTSMVDLGTGEIRQSDPVHLRK